MILTATTETAGYAPGQTIEIQLDVDNRSKQNIHEFKIGFYKVGDFFSLTKSKGIYSSIHIFFHQKKNGKKNTEEKKKTGKKAESGEKREKITKNTVSKNDLFFLSCTLKTQSNFLLSLSIFFVLYKAPRFCTIYFCYIRLFHSSASWFFLYQKKNDNR